MRTRRLGSSGLEVSVVGLGCNNFGGRIDEDASRAVVDAALDAGHHVLRHRRDVYGDRATARRSSAARSRGGATGSCSRRSSGTSSATARPRAARARYIREAVEGSLRRLGTDWIDLYQYHRPDGVTPVEETLGAMDELVQEGKVRAIGSSNFSAQQVEEARRARRASAASRRSSPTQNEYSWLVRARLSEELLPACERLGVGFIPYFPLASGLLTGKYRRGEPAPEGTRLHGRELDATRRRATGSRRSRRSRRERGVALLDVAIGGLAAQPAVASVIAGATKPEQVRANAAAGAWEPAPEELAALRAL